MVVMVVVDIGVEATAMGAEDIGVEATVAGADIMDMGTLEIADGVGDGEMDGTEEDMEGIITPTIILVHPIIIHPTIIQALIIILALTLIHIMTTIIPMTIRIIMTQHTMMYHHLDLV